MANNYYICYENCNFRHGKMTKKNDNIKEIIKEVGALIEEKEKIDNLAKAVASMNEFEQMYQGVLIKDGIDFRNGDTFEKIEKILGKEKMRMAIGQMTNYLVVELCGKVSDIDVHIGLYKIEKA